MKEVDFNRDLGELGSGQRDSDIQILLSANSAFESIPGSHFVLTGSYAVETLTGVTVNHNDMDANVLTDNLKRDLPLAVSALAGKKNFVPFRRTGTRLEYDVLSQSLPLAPRRLELQFIEVVGLVKIGDKLEFFLKPDDNGKYARVPTVTFPLLDSYGRENLFRIKSLPYAIATWAIRISGFAKNQKRSIEDRDLNHLRLLLNAGYDEEEVIRAINNHPQAPNGLSANYILDKARQTVSDSLAG